MSPLSASGRAPSQRLEVGFGQVVWTDRTTGEVVATAELGEPIEHKPESLADAFRIAPPPLLWEGDQA